MAVDYDIDLMAVALNELLRGKKKSITTTTTKPVTCCSLCGREITGVYCWDCDKPLA